MQKHDAQITSKMFNTEKFTLYHVQTIYCFFALFYGTSWDDDSPSLVLPSGHFRLAAAPVEPIRNAQRLQTSCVKGGSVGECEAATFEFVLVWA